MKKLTSEQVAEAIELYVSGKSSESIGNIYGVAGNSIRQLLKRRGITIRGQGECNKGIYHKSFNESYFSNIDDLEVNGWAGFIAADGSVLASSPRIFVECKDKDLIEAFQESLSSNHSIVFRESKSSYKLAVTSPRIVSDLEYWCITPRKSLTLQPPQHLSGDLAITWIKGFFHGDGSAYYNTCLKAINVEFVGTLSVMEWIQTILNTQVTNKLGGYLKLDKRKKNPLYHLAFQGNRQSATILQSFLELPTYSLSRKYKLLE